MKPKLVHSVPCEIRLGQASDRSYIMDSWLKAHRSSPTHRQVEKEIYYHHQPTIIDALLNQSFVIVACSNEDPDQILGYCIAQPSQGHVCVVHWIAVKQLYRKMGIGGLLFSEAKARCNANPGLPVVFTHITSEFKWLKDKWDLAYSPYLISYEVTGYDPNQATVN